MVTNEMLVATLEQMGVHFLARSITDSAEGVVSPVDLLSGLASSSESRMRLALIPFFLRRPQYAAYVAEALRHLTVAQQDLLRCYYTAAQLLQQIHHRELTALFGESVWLPDIFDDVLNLVGDEPADARLRQLAAKQAELSGQHLNWYGTYEHAYKRLIRGEVQRRRWQRSQIHRLKNF